MIKSILFIVVTLSFVLFGCVPTPVPTPTPEPTPTPHYGIPNWGGTDFISGITEHLWDYWGSPILVFFFTESCTFCHTSARSVAAMANQYPDLVVFSVAVGHTENGVRAFVNNYRIQDTVTIFEFNRFLYNQHFSSGVPAFLFIGDDMHLKHKRLGNATETVLNNLLNQYIF